MSRSPFLCICGSGKNQLECCGPVPQVTIACHNISNDQEYSEILKNIRISSEFDLRYRALFTFYGKDFITYKRLKPRDTNRNEFLRIMAEYMSHYLEDNCPTSWQDCLHPFWEELITTALPRYLHITPNEREAEVFLLELKKFVHWLDKKWKTSFGPVIKGYTEKYLAELIKVEHLLNALFLIDFPKIHHPDWSPIKDLEKTIEYKESTNSLFKITGMNENLVILTDLYDQQNYFVKGIPYHKDLDGLILDGSIHKNPADRCWNWCITGGVYPPRAKEYMIFV